MGLASFQQMKGEVPISKDSTSATLVERVGKRIAAVAPLPNAQWEFVLFESKEANAFCLPGGKVGVYTGILPYTRDEAGLATVIGHEVAHAVARHGASCMSRQMVLQGLGQITESRITNAAWQATFNKVYGLGTSVGLELPHSREQESEADYMGLLYMARAGYDPGEAVRFWQRFKEFNEKSGVKEGLKWFRTHPLSEDRIQALQAKLPEAIREYQGQSKLTQ